MRIVFDGVNRGVGAVGLLCDSLDDMWLVYNLIRVGDRVRCMTLRKVAVGAQGLKSERLLIPLEVEVADLLIAHIINRVITESEMLLTVEVKVAITEEQKTVCLIQEEEGAVFTLKTF